MRQVKLIKNKKGNSIYKSGECVNQVERVPLKELMNEENEENERERK